MPDELLAGQDTPAVTSEVTTPEPAPTNAGTDVAGTETAPSETKPPVEKTYSQQELQESIERATAKAAAKAERRAYRQALDELRTRQVQQPSQQQVDDRPRRDQFASEDDFVDKLTDWKLDQRDKGTRQQAQQQQVKTLTDKTEKLYAQAEKITGFDRDAFDELPITPVIAQAITEANDADAAKLMAHLAANPGEVDRIAALSPARQAAEIGKLETKLSAAPTVKAPKAPAPIEPIGGGSAPLKNLATMDAAEYYAARMKQRPAWARR